MLGYIFSVTTCLTLFYGFYHLVLRKHTSFVFNRLYLLFSMVASVFIPWLRIPMPTSGKGNQVLMQTTSSLQEVVIYAESIPPAFNPLLTALVGVYLLGFLVFAVRLATQIIKIRFFLQHKDTRLRPFQDAWLVDNLGKMPTFSFLDYIFHDLKKKESPKERQQILRHELAHIRQGHTYDVLLVEVFRVCFWFVPVIHLYASSLEEVHEYLADEAALEQGDASDYIRLLAQSTLDNLKIGFFRQFSKSTTIKRIRMIEAKHHPKFKWSMLGIVPLTLLLVLAFSCEKAEDYSELETLANEAELPLKDGNLEGMSISISNAMEQGNDYVRKSDNLIEARIGDRIYVIHGFKTKQDYQSGLDFIEYLKKNSGQAIRNANQNASLGNGSANDSEIFDTFALEVQPEPDGGMAGFYSYINQNLKYPESAKAMGLEGKVFLLFVIDTDGAISDVEIIKGVSPDIDREALRVVQNAPNWKPGMQKGQAVKVRMRLPITFKIN